MIGCEGLRSHFLKVAGVKGGEVVQTSVEASAWREIVEGNMAI